MDDNDILSMPDIWLNILSNISNSVYIINKDLKVIYINKAAERSEYFGDNIIGKSIFDIFPNLTRENSTFLKVLADGKPIERLNEYVIGNGKRKISLASVYPIIKDGEMVGAYEIGEDLSAISQLLEKQLFIPEGSKSRQDGSKYKTEENIFFTVDSILGVSNHIKKLKEDIAIIANSPSNTLIYGETGTGKELVVQSIYSIYSKSRVIPFVAQNCAAIPETLLESLLFGTVKGSFTGAENRQGLFELANNGVLFLDEINSMPLNLQAKILRVIQEGKIRRVGGQSEIPVNFKLISSTNVHPNALLETGEIRADLFYRLNVLYIELLPLRERREDIPILLRHYINMYNEKLNRNVVDIDEKTMDFFMNYEWPGNIRELRNIVERMINMSKDKIIKFDMNHNILRSTSIKKKLTPVRRIEKEEIRGLKEAIIEYEIEIIKNALQQKKGNISKAARALDIPQQTLNYKVDRYNLKDFVKNIKDTIK